MTKQYFVNLAPDPVLQTTVYPITIVFSIIVFLMELRRILRWPKRWSSELDNDKCGVGTAIFVGLPCVLSIGFVLKQMRLNSDMVSVLDRLVSPDGNKDLAIVDLYNAHRLDYYMGLLSLVGLMIINGLIFRYLLMYFPQLQYTTAMVRKLLF